MTTYRDVLIFYDSSNNIVQQAQICLACGDIEIYPVRDFMCQEESDLDYNAFRVFIKKIKQGQP